MAKRARYVTINGERLGAPTKRDRDAGYEACMFCVETGDVAGHAGHDTVWDVWEDRMADARNSAF